MGSKLPPFRAALLEVADEHARRAVELRADARLLAAEMRSFGLPQVEQMLREADRCWSLATAAKAAADEIAF